jgi:hypothetical protein
MRTKLTKITLTATIAFAITFTINACSSDSNDDNGGIHDDGSLSSLPEYQERQEQLKYYDPADAEERCKNGVVEYRCEVDGNEVWYNPLKQSCAQSTSCSNNDCETTYHGLYTYERCGNEIITSNHEYIRCNGGVVEEICKTADGDKWYNYNTHYCDYTINPGTMTDTGEIKAKGICGNVYYYPRYDACKNGVVGKMCGQMTMQDGKVVYGDDAEFYNDETHYCDRGFGMMGPYMVKPRVLCGNKYIEESERCNNGVIEDGCGYYFPGMEDNRQWYNSMTQTCTYTGEVRNKVRCGN